MAHKLSGRSVLVVGGCGFIGSNLVRRLESLGAATTVVDCLASWGGGYSEHLRDLRGDIESFEFDVRQAARYEHVFQHHDIVFVLIGAVGHVESMREPQADLARNCTAHLSLLEVLRRTNPEAKLVVTTTRQIYGRPQQLPVDETHPILPVDINGIHWHAVESYYRLYQEAYGLRSACLRLTNTYGPRMSLRRACHGFAPVAFREALRGRPIRLFGDGLQRRDFNYVDDVVDAMLSAAELEMKRHEAYNLGSREPTALRDFCAALTSHLDVPILYEPFPNERKVIDVGNYAASFVKFQQATDWLPKTSLDDGVRRTVEYYRNHPQDFSVEQPYTSSRPASATKSFEAGAIR